jgi:hypothetical protein
MYADKFSISRPQRTTRSSPQTITVVNQQSHILNEAMILVVVVKVSFDKALCRFENLDEWILGFVVEKQAQLKASNWTELCFKF